MVGKIMTPQIFHAAIPITYEHCYLTWQRDFVDVIKDMVYTMFAFPSKLSFYITNMYCICTPILRGLENSFANNC